MKPVYGRRLCELTRRKPVCRNTTNDGLTAVHLLARKNATFIIQQLAKDGVDITARDSNGETVLFHGLGAGKGYADLIKIFKDHGGDLNAPNVNEVT